MLAEGAVLAGRYRLAEPLGEGGMAHSFRAHDLLLGHDLTLKALRVARPDLIELFRHEFARLRGLVHPALMRVRDFGAHRGSDGQWLRFYTADYIEGVTLRRFAAERAADECIAPLADALRALSFLHGLGIRHGDFKPDNVVVDARGRGVLIDLGASAPLRTATGVVSGTPGFLAPELLQGAAGDERSDLYSVGVTLARILAPDDSGPLRDLVARLQSEDPDDRPAAVADVLPALGGGSRGPQPPRGRAPRLVGRSDELTRFTSLLEALIDDTPAPRALVSSGPPGIGKSRLLMEMKWLAQERCRVVETTGLAPDPVRFLLAALGEESPERPSIEDVLRAHDRAAAGDPVVIVIDALDAMSAADRDLVLSWLRVSSPEDRCLSLVAAREPVSIEAPGLVQLELGPLGADAIASWIGDDLPRGSIAELLRLTGGVPSYVEAALSRVSGSEIALSELASSSLEAGDDASLAALSPEARRALLWMAVAGRDTTAALLHELGASVESLSELQQNGWIVLGDAGWSLARQADAAAILGPLDAHEARALHRELAAREVSEPARAQHLVSAGAYDDAQAVLAGCAQPLATDPGPWLPVARAALEHADDDELPLPLLVAAAEIAETAGRPDLALRLLARALRKRPPPSVRARIRAAAGGVYLKLGQHDHAVRELRLAERGPADAAMQAHEPLSRALRQRGAYREALSVARTGLSRGPSRELTLRLHENAGVAASYLGETAEARDHLAQARRLADELGDPRSRVRVASYEAILDYRSGDLDAAIAGHRAALQTAEQHGLTDQVASAASNLGTVHQQLGDWGPALRHYERALRIATAVGRKTTQLSLRFNIANLHASIGLFERAERAIGEVRRDAAAAKLELEGPALLVLGEIAMAKEQHAPARDYVERAAAAFAAQGARREGAEAELLLAELDTSDGSNEAAAGHVRAAAAIAAGLDSPDLSCRVRMVEGRLALVRGNGDEAMMMLEEACRFAERSRQRLLVGYAELELAEASRAQGAEGLYEQHLQRARLSLSRIAASLSPELRDCFWRHPQRRGVAERPSSDAPKAAKAQDDAASRLLSVNKRLNSSLDVEQVLAFAMDAAVELTRAERGFVLLHDDETAELEVAIARNLDREKVGRSHLKFSHGIAARVIESGDPVLTTDASVDERFRDNASVHAMRLRSVACVPIRSPDGTLGALYLDNRFQQGLFGPQDVQTLLSLADQVAIAVRNARLHGALAERTRQLSERTRQLEAQKAKVEALLAGSEREVDRLAQEVQVRQEALEHRFDYSRIIGRGPAMRRVLSVLDRVIDSPVSVLIAGPSGSGKELVAGAIHYNSPRREGPFVSINCGALPETLLESELFGHVKGAFTGADRDRTGLFVQAEGGTLFLDELGEMPPSLQVKLLRALQERRVRPVGSSQDTPVDIRVVAATNRNLRQEIERGRFREDLYYRIAVVEVELPPLSERREDIPALVRAIVGRLAESHGRPVPRLARDVLPALVRSPWPGNVRQLENVLTRAFLMAKADRLTAADLELPKARAEPARDREEFERREAKQILSALEAHRWNVRAVSRALGIPSNTLYRKLKRYRIERPARSRKSG